MVKGFRLKRVRHISRFLLSILIHINRIDKISQKNSLQIKLIRLT